MSSIAKAVGKGKHVMGEKPKVDELRKTVIDFLKCNGVCAAGITTVNNLAGGPHPPIWPIYAKSKIRRMFRISARPESDAPFSGENTVSFTLTLSV